MENMARTDPPKELFDPDLKEALTLYEIHHAEDRQYRDGLVALWLRKLQDVTKETEINWKLYHQVLNSMDEFLIRSKK